VNARKTYFCSGKVLDRMCCSRLEQEHFGQDDLVIQLLQLFQKALGHGQRLSVVFRIDLPGIRGCSQSGRAVDSQSDELDLEALSEEHPLLLSSPGDVVVCDLHLQVPS
jgi:hypothetical protein